MQWFLVWTKPRQEQRAEHNLRNQGFNIFAPRISERRRVGSRMQDQNVALFPRYVFLQAQASRQNLAVVRSTPGCVDLVRMQGRPVQVPSRVIAQVEQRLEHLRHESRPSESWQPGDPLEVVGGPFAGVQAVFQQACGAGRVRVLLQWMGQWHRASVEQDLLRTA
jgi:transcriptional antiterminator RfaH